MGEQGYVEGQNLLMEVQRNPFEREQIRAGASELVARRPDVIVATTPTLAAVARDATQTIPIVFAISADPIGQGLVASLARPGGNVTGLSALSTALSGKRVELLAETVRPLERLALLYQPINADRQSIDESAAAARMFGIEPVLLETAPGQHLDAQFETAVRQRADALLALPGSGEHRADLARLAAQHRLPTMGPQRDFVVAGALMSYGPSFHDSFRRAAYLDFGHLDDRGG
jgi:putative tryptophan/tyrosine transport system substrate-binding protein